MKQIFELRSAVKIIYFNGSNIQEVIDFFMSNTTKRYGKFLQNINNELHFKVRDYHSRKMTLIKPGFYIKFTYDEDDWWTPCHVSKEELEKNYIEIEI